MEYIRIPHVKGKVSRIIFGTAMKPFNEGKSDDALLDAVLAMGVTVLDTARVYGGAEEALGGWLERTGCRDRIVILSKCGHFDLETGRRRVCPEAMRADLQTSLEALHTDFIDIYLLHRDNPDVPVGPLVETFNEMHAEGRIGAFGGSNWTHERIEEANEYAYAHNLIPFEVSSPNFGLADQIEDPWGQGCVTIAGPRAKEAREWYRRNGMPVIAYSSLAHGFFSGRLKSTNPEDAPNILDAPAVKGYVCPENFERLRRCEQLAGRKKTTVPQLAMAWMFHLRLNLCAVVSTSRPDRMKRNIDALALPLTDEECRWMNLEE